MDCVSGNACIEVVYKKVPSQAEKLLHNRFPSKRCKCFPTRRSRRMEKYRKSSSLHVARALAFTAVIMVPTTLGRSVYKFQFLRPKF